MDLTRLGGQYTYCRIGEDFCAYISVDGESAIIYARGECGAIRGSAVMNAR